MDGGILDLHVGSLITLSTSLEGPLPIPTTDPPNSHCQFPVVFGLPTIRRFTSTLPLPTYISLNQVICMVLQFGKGALMAKFDVEAVYHNIAVHPSITWA